jgi:hypothetical protein
VRSLDAIVAMCGIAEGGRCYENKRETPRARRGGA